VTLIFPSFFSFFTFPIYSNQISIFSVDEQFKTVWGCAFVTFQLRNLEKSVHKRFLILVRVHFFLSFTIEEINAQPRTELWSKFSCHFSNFYLLRIIEKHWKMDLEKLPELALEKLVEQCDRSSKLNLMLVSKRFYNLIGRNPRLCELKFCFVLFLKISDLMHSNRQRLPAELEERPVSIRNNELRSNLWINCVHKL
jgi:hypothetical protein